jgi:hypothetical protein
MDRNELHELVMLLKDGLASGKIEIPSGSRARAALDKVRLDADGRVDPETVDGSVRAAGRAFAAANALRALRQIPLRDVQANYFDILEQFFGTPFAEMRKHGVTPAEVATHLVSQERIVGAFRADLKEFSSCVREFWEHCAPIVEAHLAEIRGLKSVFGGDVFPSYGANIPCSVGLYVDTLVLPDPLLRLLSFAEFTEPKKALGLVAKHALSALSCRDLALADVSPPIIVFAPDPMILEGPYAGALEATSDGDVVEHASKVFGRRFSSAEELHGFLAGFPNAEELAKRVAEPARFLFDLDWSEPLPEQIARHFREMQTSIPPTAGMPFAESTYRAFLGRMMQTNDLLFRSARYRGTPLIEAETSWQYLLWKYEYDAARSGELPTGMRDAVISKVISTEGGTEFGMLSGVPPEMLIELRRNGALAELRSIFCAGLSQIDLASAADLPEIADAVVGNVDRAFEEHERQLKDLSSSRRKFFGFDVGRLITFGGVSIAAAMSHNAGLEVLAAASSIAGAPSIPDLRKQWQELRSRSQKLQRSPAAILFRHLSGKFGFRS